MSPNVSSFVHDLVEMAKATEQVPALHSRVHELEKQVDHYAQQVQHRELALIETRNEIEALRSKLRDAEVARDVAEYRFLELDEKASKTLGDLEAIVTLVYAARAELTPPAPAPQPEPSQEPTPEVFPTSGGEVTPSEASAMVSSGETATGSITPSEPSVAGSETNEGNAIVQAFPEEPAKYDSSGYVTNEWYEWNDKRWARA